MKLVKTQFIIDPKFWQEAFRYKLETDKLDEKSVSI